MPYVAREEWGCLPSVKAVSYAAPTSPGLDGGCDEGALEVDLLGLTRLATALDRIGDGLEAARGELRGFADSLGDEQVVDGVERFEDRWRDGRKEIRANAEALSLMLTESVGAYRQADTDLAASLTTTSLR